MRRFVLIDQSITGEGGHYLSYARAVLDSAAEEGFLPVLCVNQRFCTANGLPHRIYPAFTYTSLEALSSFRLSRSSEDGDRLRYLWGGVIKPAIQRVARTVFGANYGKVRAHLFPQNSVSQKETKEQSYKTACFAKDLCSLLSLLRLNKEDIVFFPTISVVELRGLKQTLQRMGENNLPTFRLLFRWSLFRGRRQDYSNELPALGYIQDNFRACEVLYTKGILRFYTDSDRLSEQYNLFSQCMFSVLPIPHTQYPTINIRHEKKVISYLGDARIEKGFIHLPEIVDALSSEDVQFQIQANYNIPGGEGGIAICRKRLQQKKNVMLYESALDAGEYTSALSRTDIMLILYDPKQYYARSSGIFAEAIALGIPALVPADTWMSEQVCRGRYKRFSEIVEMFGVCQADLEVTGSDFCWKRKTDSFAQIILHFVVDWKCSCNSVRVEAVMESDCEEEIKKGIDFIERAENNDCFLLFKISSKCRQIRFHLSGTYGQVLPKICSVRAVELCDNAPDCGNICEIFDSFDQCGEILKTMIEFYTTIRDSAELYSKSWSSYHNPKSLVNQFR